MQLTVIARDVADLIERRPLPVLPVRVELSDDDAEERLGLESYGHADGQTFMIDYVDSAKRPSRRPITVFSVEAGANGVPVLKARCHARKATRAFRIDRIQCCIDFDGEIFEDVPLFLVENFGMHPALASLVSGAEDVRRWTRILEVVRDDATLLAAVAHSDGNYHPAEADAVVDHLSRLAERDGVMMSQAEMLALQRYSRKLRPGYDRVLEALGNLQLAGSSHCQRLIHAGIAVMDADGERRDIERRLLSAISAELLGVGAAF